MNAKPVTSSTDDQREQSRAAQIEKNQAAIALLRAWRIEDANVSREEKAIREAEGRALEAGLAVHPLTLREVCFDESTS